MKRFSLDSACKFEETIKKSRFIAYAHPLIHLKDAQSLVQTLSLTTASHNCWAYRFEASYRFCDDGEPASTAGKPIFSAIEQHGIDKVLIIVSRYYGGIKLGTGGLARAYGGTASKCFDRAKKIEIFISESIKLQIPHKFTHQLYGLLSQFDLSPLSKIQDETTLVMTLTIKSADKRLFTRQLFDATSGKARILVDSIN